MARRSVPGFIARRLAPAPDFDAARRRLRQRLGPEATLPLPDARIVIAKGKREAGLYAGGDLVCSYTIALGRKPTGGKALKGDKRTPEGNYRLCTRLDESQYHLFLGINYPNATDARRAAESGQIGSQSIAAVTAAQAAQRRPPWDTELGGAIGLHGGGTAFDWTLGCIAFENPDIEEIRVATCHWTPVDIRP